MAAAEVTRQLAAIIAAIIAADIAGYSRLEY
jgi:hypothetical protein